MVTLQGKVNEVITEHEVKKLRRFVYSGRWMIARDFWCQEEGSAQCFRKWFARNAPLPVDHYHITCRLAGQASDFWLSQSARVGRVYSPGAHFKNGCLIVWIRYLCQQST